MAVTKKDGEHLTIPLGALTIEKGVIKVKAGRPTAVLLRCDRGRRLACLPGGAERTDCTGGAGIERAADTRIQSRKPETRSRGQNRSQLRIRRRDLPTVRKA